jgi:predicted RNA-binding Zn-ribbon protein involved in translation (DUF1610 family)
MPDGISTYNSNILSHPPQPGWMRQCPRCGKWFALQFASRRKHELVGAVSVYRCAKCGCESEFAERHPPNAV